MVAAERICLGVWLVLSEAHCVLEVGEIVADFSHQLRPLMSNCRSPILEVKNNN